MSESILGSTEIPLKVEYEDGLITQLSAVLVEVNSSCVVFTLGNKHTECPVPDSCDVNTSCGSSEPPSAQNSCC